MASTNGYVVAFFSSEREASDAIQALHAAGFQPHHIGAARAGMAAGSQPSDSDGVVGTMGFGAEVEKIWDKVRSFFDVNQGSGQYRSDERANQTSARGITGGAYPYDHGDLAYLLKGLSVPVARAQYFEHRLSGSPGSVLLTLSAPEREEEAQRILIQHGGDLGRASAEYDSATKPAYSDGSSQPHIELLGEVLRVQEQRRNREDVPEFRIPLMNEEPSDREIAVREEIAVGKRSSGGVDARTASVHQERLDDLPHDGPATSEDRKNFDARAKAR